MDSAYIKSLLQAILACFLWGMVFAMPLFLNEHASIDIVLGRFFIYGLCSIFLLGYFGFVKNETTVFKFYREAFWIALIMNVLYFSALTFGSRLTSSSMITLIIGTSPVTITFFSCLIKKDKKLLSLFLIPSLLIICGLWLMSREAISEEIHLNSFSNHIKGFFFGIIALFSWTWYVIYNAKVLNEHKEINPIHWTALIGGMTFIFSLMGLSYQYIMNGPDYFLRFDFSSTSHIKFWIGIFTLGIVCSFIAFSFWNAAGQKLHPAITGQISILETFFGLTLIYILQNEFPSILEFIGAILILSGVSIGVYSYSKNDQEFIKH